MERIRIQSQARRSKPASRDHCAVSTTHRLANLVRRHGLTVRISVDTAFRLETFAQRSGYALPAGQQSIPECTAALHPRTTLSLRIRAAWRSRVVETRTDRRMAARSL